LIGAGIAVYVDRKKDEQIERKLTMVREKKKLADDNILNEDDEKSHKPFYLNKDKE